MIDMDDKGFLLVKKTYKVTCHNPHCELYGRGFNAVLGEEPILDGTEPLYEICLKCNTYSVGAITEKKR